MTDPQSRKALHEFILDWWLEGPSSSWPTPLRRRVHDMLPDTGLRVIVSPQELARWSILTTTHRF
jgi:hypothetical protein